LSKGFDGNHFITGLASHFRDLLVSKDKITVELLEVGDNAKKKYLSQSEKCELKFLLQGIELANECDLKYKSSKNQRLLVELTLMQLASVTFDGEKKNSKPYIISAVVFRSKIAKKSIAKFVVKEEIKVVAKQEVPVIKYEPKIAKTPSVEGVKAELINTEPRRSALSLKSLERKTEVAKIEVEFEEVEGLPMDAFSESKLLLLWEEYIALLMENGKKSVASIMNSNVPRLENGMIHFQLPNAMMKEQLDRAKQPLIKYLREKLNNFKLDIVVDVNEEETKNKYAYTPEEKYLKLREKNNAIELLKKTFDLDI
jgi:DNA polymerase-3 subunit gamma/tau